MGKEDFYMWKRLGYESYGKYMINKEPSPKEPRSERVCANCGYALVGKRIKFCCNECREKFKTKKRRGDVYV